MEYKPNRKNQNITIIDEEFAIWEKELFDLFIPIPIICKYCKYGKLGLKKYNSLINPYIGKCSNYKCTMNIYLRIATLFEHNNKTPASVLFQILKYWLIDKLNCQKISVKLKEKYKLNTINLLQNFYYYVEKLQQIICKNY